MLKCRLKEKISINTMNKSKQLKVQDLVQNNDTFLKRGLVWSHMSWYIRICVPIPSFYEILLNNLQKEADRKNNLGTDVK